MKKEKTVGVIVGRFQVAELHDEHRRLIKSIYDTHIKTIIFLGVSRFKTTKNNPLDFESRKAMIEAEFPCAIILYVPDYRTDEEWSADLDNQISLVCGPYAKPTLYGGRESFISHYKGRYLTEEIKPERYVSGSDCRARLGESIKRSGDFRAGVIWATENQYTRIFPTVDITVAVEIHNGDDNGPNFIDDYDILVARKPGETKYRFIGGFVETGCDNLEEEAVRELKEEGGCEIAPSLLQYVCSHNVRDWRVSGEKERIVTTFFMAKLEEMPEVVAGDDINFVKFVPLSQLKKEDFFPGHQYLLQKLKDKL